MKFNEYVTAEVKRLGCSRAAVYDLLVVRGADLSYPTLKAVDQGMRLVRYGKAKSLSEATGGAVTVEDLCETGEKK